MDLPSVTQVLSTYTDFSRVDPFVLLHATERGQSVHRISAGIARGLWVPRVPPDQQGYVESFREWFLTAVERVIFVEKEFICTCHNFVGHPDLGVVLKGDTCITIPDLKTPITEGPTWKGQSGAYLHLVEEHGGYDLPALRAGSLMLDPKGKQAKLIEHTNSATDFNAFVAALTAWRYFK